MAQIIEFDYDLHHSDLHRLNIEYVTWVAEQQRLALEPDLEQILGMSIGEYVESFLEKFGADNLVETERNFNSFLTAEY